MVEFPVSCSRKSLGMAQNYLLVGDVQLGVCHTGIQRFIQNQFTSFNAYSEGFLGDSLISGREVNVHDALTL